MNISTEILDFLKQFGTVKVPGFGVFTARNTGALLDSETKTILPPGKQIHFEADYELQDQQLQNFIVGKNNAPDAVNHALKVQTDYWKKMLLNKDAFSAEGLGDFYVAENEIVFKGKRIQSEAPDFYGLEEINISQIRNNADAPEPVSDGQPESYRLNRSILWFFLLAVPVAGLAYLGITQQERIFGKKSFDDLSVKTSTHRIVEDSAKIKAELQKAAADSLKISDSLRQDSLSKAAVIPVKKSTKKWTSSNKLSSKKYTKKKWRPKKRQNR